MNLLKKILFWIIAIESLVLLEVLILKGWDIVDEKKQEVIVSENRVYPVVHTPKYISQREQKILLKSLNEQKENIKRILFNSNSLKFLYSKEIHHKVTEALERYSKSFLGKPYVWGATGPDRFDCSGFTQKVYGEWGIKIPRHSTHQAKVGKYVEYKDLERGDMVFFDTERKSTGVVNHVGIYLEDGKFIHASSGNKKVVITNFNEKPFYRKRFLWGRRVVKNTILKPPPSFSLKSIEYLFSSLNFKEKESPTYPLDANTLAFSSF